MILDLVNIPTQYFLDKLIIFCLLSTSAVGTYNLNLISLPRLKVSIRTDHVNYSFRNIL